MKKIKSTSVVLLTIILTFMLVSCENASVSTDYTAREIANVIAGTQEDLALLISITEEDDAYLDYLSQYYAVDEETLVDGAIYQASDRAIADEIVVLRFDDVDSAAAGATALEEYKHNRTGDFTGYVPEEEAVAQAGIIAQNETFVTLIICDAPDIAKESFDACFSESAPSIPTSIAFANIEEDDNSQSEEDDTSEVDENDTSQVDIEDDGEYNHDKVLNAWETGDISNLNEKNKVVYGIVSGAINSLTTEDMTDYEKELVLHDYIVATIDYDRSAIGATEDTVTSPEHDNPYGALVHGKAICSGYTSTFQLMMDMVGIECLTVNGTAHDGTDEHAWNMVKLDDEWYFVDATWNDPTAAGQQTGEVWHTYFNVTSEKMRDSNHQWDESAFPVAESDTYSYE